MAPPAKLSHLHHSHRHYLRNPLSDSKSSLDFLDPQILSTLKPKSYNFVSFSKPALLNTCPSIFFLPYSGKLRPQVGLNQNVQVWKTVPFFSLDLRTNLIIFYFTSPWVRLRIFISLVGENEGYVVDTLGDIPEVSLPDNS